MFPFNWMKSARFIGMVIATDYSSNEMCQTKFSVTGSLSGAKEGDTANAEGDG